MDPSLIDEVKESLEPLADKLGEGAAFLFELAVRQSIVHGITLLLLIVASIIVVIWSVQTLPRSIQLWNDSPRDSWDEARGIAGAWIKAIASLALTIVIVINTQTMVKNLVNPQWAAIERIVDTVKGTRNE